MSDFEIAINVKRICKAQEENEREAKGKSRLRCTIKLSPFTQTLTHTRKHTHTRKSWHFHKVLTIKTTPSTRKLVSMGCSCTAHKTKKAKPESNSQPEIEKPNAFRPRTKEIKRNEIKWNEMKEKKRKEKKAPKSQRAK